MELAISLKGFLQFLWSLIKAVFPLLILFLWFRNTYQGFWQHTILDIHYSYTLLPKVGLSLISSFYVTCESEMWFIQHPVKSWSIKHSGNCTVSTTEPERFYTFPSFCNIRRVLSQILHKQVHLVILMMPHWQTQL